MVGAGFEALFEASRGEVGRGGSVCRAPCTARPAAAPVAEVQRRTRRLPSISARSWGRPLKRNKRRRKRAV